MFRDAAGYTCGLAGKLHLASCADDRVEARIDDGYADDHFHWSHHPQPDWGRHNAYQAWLADRGLHWEELYNHPPHPNPYVRHGVPAAHHQTTWCAETTIDFLREQAESEKPWFFSFNCFAPHHPFDPPVEYLERYDPADMPLPGYREGELESKPRFQQLDHQWAHNSPGEFHTGAMDDDDRRLVTAAYYAMCEHIDHEMGRILGALEETGQAANTLVVFMSDHGEMLGDHGIYFKGPHFYDQAIRVPLILRYPGHYRENHRVDALTELIDLAPTLLEAAGIDPPPDRLQGKSLTPLLAGETATHRDHVFCEYYNSWTHGDAYASCLRTQTHKLVRYHTTDEGELYDLETDPGEFDNLWNTPEHRELQLDLLTRTFDTSVLTMDPSPPREGPF
jgi:arylsulfatase